MNDRSQTCQRWNGSLSSGVAWTRVLFAIVAVIALIVAVKLLFPSREDRLFRFVDAERLLVLDGSTGLDGRAKFLDGLDPAVRYQRSGGMTEILRDYKRFRAVGVDTIAVPQREAKLDAEGADVKLDVVLLVGLQPVAQVTVRLRAVEDGDRAWRITQISWE